jgi:peptidoglycan/xylan/chitin deacetylase (PgdA/CDA1 family)
VEALLIAILFFALSEVWRIIRRLFGWQVPGTAVAIYYHRVPSEERARFARQMDHLLRWVEPIRADHMEPLRPGTRSAIVTFDDGWVSFVENALPELQRREIPATLFAVSDFLDGDDQSLPIERLVSAQELRSLDPRLITVGSHSATHSVMTALPEPEARRELRESRAKLEEVLERPVKLFCFPYGRFNEALIEMCREAGYARVFTGQPFAALCDPQEFATGRVRVDPFDWPIEFHLKLTGAYIWMPLAMTLKSWVVSNLRSASSLFVRRASQSSA